MGTVADPNLFIANEWSPVTTCQTFDIANPATGEVMGQATRGGRADAISAQEAASRTFPSRCKTTGDGPSRLLKNTGQSIYDQSEYL